MVLKRLTVLLVVVGAVLFISDSAGALINPPDGVPQLPAVSAPPAPSLPSLVQIPEVPALPAPSAAPAPVPEPPVVDAVASVPDSTSSAGADSGPAPLADASGPGAVSLRTAGSSTPSTDPSGQAPSDSSGTGRSNASRPATPSPAAERRFRQTVEQLSGCLSSVAPYDAAVLALRAGLGSGSKPLSRTQVAQRLRTTGANVQRAEQRGVRALKAADSRTGCGEAASGPAGGAGPSVEPAQPVLALVGSLVSGRSTSPPAVAHTRHNPGTRPQPSSGRPDVGVRHASATSVGGNSYLRWILVLIGLLIVVSLVVLVERRRPAVLAAPPRRRRKRPKPAKAAKPVKPAKVELSCSYCQSRTVVFNPRLEIYRCVDCGFSGALPPAFLAKVGRMQADPAAGEEVARRSKR